MAIRILFTSLLSLVASPLFAASPSLSGIAPVGGQRGTEIVLNFNGVRLADAQEVLVYYPGIVVKKIEAAADNSVKATIAIAADCRLGEHIFRVRTASGISDARAFWVGALPTVNEKEPNNDFNQPEPIALNCTVHGSIGSEDVDYFVVEGKKGQRLSVEVEGMRLGAGFWDPFVAILNDKRFELATSDDTPLTGQDSGCSIILPADGKYTVMLRESAYGSGSVYRLHIGNFPRPTAIIPAGGKPGETIEFRFIGDPAGEIRQKIQLPATADPYSRLHCQTPEGISPTGFRARIIDLPNVIETVPNNQPATALVGTFPCAFNGVVNMASETRYFRINGAKKGHVYEIRCYARQIGSPLDPVLHISDANAAQLGTYRMGNDDSNGPDSYFRFTVPEDKDYFLHLHDHLRKGGPDYFFRIEVTAVEARTTTTIPRVDGNNPTNQDRQSITVPQGGRFATMVNVNRADWGGIANLTFPALPAGVTPLMEAIEPGSGAIPVVFEAKVDAPLAMTLSSFVALPADPKVIAKPMTMIEPSYNIGVNNTPFHKHPVDRIAVAVVAAAPYSIEVIEPKAAIPQNGAMNLRVVAKRAPGFTKPITISPLFSPPGLGIQGTATIPENGTETVLPMNASGNAVARKWKTAVIASADAGQGPIWTSSQLFTLEVSTPFMAFAQERSAVEQGNATQLFGKLTPIIAFPGEATAQLVGLPPKATAPDLKINKDSKELSFAITTDKSTPAGKHNVFCRLLVNINGETVSQTLGGGELRVDVPLPPKVAVVPTPAPTPTPTPTPSPAPTPNQPPPKRLTRLEQLRLEQQEREKAAKAGQTPPTAKKEEPKK